MRLVVDASALVAEGLRIRGRRLLSDDRLEFYATSKVLAETTYELDRRIARLIERGAFGVDDAARTRGEIHEILNSRIFVIAQWTYEPHLIQARWRVSNDPSDQPTAAQALDLACGVWTLDHDFFGSGIATWSTETLLAYLAYQDSRPADDTQSTPTQ